MALSLCRQAWNVVRGVKSGMDQVSLTVSTAKKGAVCFEKRLACILSEKKNWIRCIEDFFQRGVGLFISCISSGKQKTVAILRVKHGL